MKKHLFKSFALIAMLFSAMTMSAKQYCQEPLTLNGGATIKLSCELVSDGQYRITIEGENLNGLGGSFYNPGAKLLKETITSSTSTKIVCDIAAESAPTIYTPFYVLCPGEQSIGWPSDIDWTGTCGAGGEEPTPDPTPDPEPEDPVTPSVVYCDFPTGHNGDANFGDANGRILVSLIKQSETAVRLVVKSADAATKNLDLLYVEAAGANPHATTVGSDVAESDLREMSVDITYPTAPAKYTFMIQWSHPDWAGRWQTNLNDITVEQLCTEGGSEGGEEPEPTPDPEESIIVGTYIAPNWVEDPTSSATYDANTGTITVDIKNALSSQWQGQVKVKHDVAFSADKQYTLSCKFHATADVNGVTLKMDDNAEVVFENQSISLQANKDFVYTSAPKNGIAGNNQILVFDFGWAPACQITISDIVIQEVEPTQPEEPAEPEVVESNYCQTPLTSGTNTIYLTCEKVSDGNYRMTVEGENLTGFGGSFYNPGGKDLRDAITSLTSTKIVCDIAAESAPVFYTPLYVNMPGEVNYGTISDVIWGTCPEPEVSVLTTLTATAASSICKVGETVAITIVAKDQYGITMDAGTVNYAVSPADAGTVVENVFTPSKAGLATITASVGSVQATAIEIFAYEDGANLALSTNINTDNKVIAQSDFAPSGTDAWNAVDGNEGSVWQGSATNGGAGDDAARTYDSWFVVDLGAHYNLNLVTITFEGACSQNYTVAVSSDYINWNTAYTHNGSAGVNGRTDNLFGNNLNNATNVRFVRFWSTKAATQWGVKVFEFKVYGTKVADKVVGTNNPAMQSATLKSTTPTSATLTLSATDADNTGIVKYHVKDEANGLDKIVTSLTNDFFVKGLKDNTTYTLVVAAIDVDGNESAPFTMESFTTAADPTKPTTSAPVPTRDEEDVLSFYSDAYTPVINLGWTNAWTNALYTEETIAGDKYLHYSDKQDWGWEFGVKDGYTDGVNTGVDCSAMEFLHVDVWGYEAGTIRVIPIYGGANLTSNERYYAEIEVKAGQWNSVDVALTDFMGSGDKHDFTSIHQFKFSNRSMIVAIDNVYFWKSAGTLPVESVTLDKTTATIEVEEALQLKATVLPMEAANKNVVWTSSDATVANVVDGLVTGLKEGTTTITATSAENGEIKATCAITVEPITVKTWWGEPTTITVDGQEIAVLYCFTRNVDKTITYTAIFGTDKAFVKEINVESLSTDFKGLTYDANTLTASWNKTDSQHNKGEVITGFWWFAAHRIEFTYIVGSSNERPNTAVTSVTLDKTSCDLLVDETVQLLATVNPGIAANKNVTWTSSNTAVATVDANGLVTAKSAGTAIITVTTADGGKTATCTINVVAALTDAIYHANAFFVENKRVVGVNYTITRTPERKLRYEVKVNAEVVGLVMQMNDGAWRTMVYDAVANSYTYTSEQIYTDGATISGFFYPQFAGGADRWDYVNYVVGSTNTQPLTMVGVNDNVKNDINRLAQYTTPVDVAFGRSFSDEYWQTISLPFALNAVQVKEIFGENVQVLKLAKAGVAPDQAMELGFSEVTSIQAATPYLIKPSKKVNNVTVVRGVTLSTTAQTVKVSNVTMHALLEQIDYDYTTDDVVFFMGGDNYLYYQATDNTLFGLRAYFTFDGITTYAQATNMRARIVLEENETTGFDQIVAPKGETIKAIVNGQLVIIRGGEMYNVQGQKL